MIEKLNIENFKSFADRQEIPIKPITLIYGANSSGKSSILQMLLMLKQTLELANSTDIPLQPSGIVELGNFTEFVNSHEKDKSIFINITVNNLPKSKNFHKGSIAKVITTTKFSMEFEFRADPDIYVKQIKINAGDENICILTPFDRKLKSKGQLNLFFLKSSQFYISAFNWEALFWKEIYDIYRNELLRISEKTDKSNFLNDCISRKKEIELSLEKTENEKISFINELENLLKFKDDLDDYKTELEDKKDELENYKDELSDKNNEMENKVIDLSIKKSKMQSLQENFKRKIEEGVPAHNLADLNNEFLKLKDEVPELKTEISNLEDEIDDIGGDIESIGHDIESISSEIYSIEEKIDKYNLNIEDLGSDISSVGDDISGLGGQIQTFNDSTSEIYNKVSELDEKISELDGFISDLEYQFISELEDRISKLENELKPLDEMKNKIKELDQEIEYHINIKKIIEDNDFEIIRSRCQELYKYNIFNLKNFLPIVNKSQPIYANKMFLYRYNLIDLVELIQFLSNEIETFLEKIAYIGPLREKPDRSYTFDGNLYEYVGSSGKMVPNILFKNTKLINEINPLFEKMGLDYKLEIVSLSENNESIIDTFSVRLIELSTGIKVSVLDVGFGISQLLPIIVQSLLSQNKILLIEQPEIHLHPKLQGELGEFFAKNIKRTQNKFIIETHSENIILRLKKLIKKKELSKDDVSVIYVDKTKNGSVCHILKLDDNGDFIDNWPNGFFEESFEEIFG
ncbi:MAG: DUF3696 domain-containing protein [bacterium]